MESPTRTGGDGDPGKSGARGLIADESSGGLSIADEKLLRRAVRGGWPVSPEKRKAIAMRLAKVATKKTIDGESELDVDANSIRAGQVLVAMDRADIAALTAASSKATTQVNVNIETQINNAIECELARLALAGAGGNAGPAAGNGERAADIAAATRAALIADSGPALVHPSGGNGILVDGSALGGNGRNGNGRH